MSQRLHYENCIAELSVALKVHRLRNYCLGQCLFRLEGTLRRLYLIKLLLSALPDSLVDEINEYKKVTNLLSAYMLSLWQTDTEEIQENVAADVAQRIP